MPTHTDRAADLMRGTAGPVLPLRRLADLLGVPSTGLVAELDRDARFRVVRAASALEVTAVWTTLGPAYTSVLEAAGLTPSCTIVLVDRGGHDDSVAALLARTLGCLLDLPAGAIGGLTESGIQVGAALAPLMPGAGTSTTPPPPARPPAPAPPRRRRPSWRPPHAPGSPRG